MTLLFEFGRPLPAAEMRLQCRGGTQVLDCKGVYCSAHNAAVPSGIRDSESVGPGQTRIRPNTAAGQKRRRLSWHPETAGVVAESAPEASPALSSSLAAPGTLSSLSSSPPAPASPSLPAFAVLDVAVAAFGGGGGARAGGSAGYNTQNKPRRGCTCRMLRCTNGLLDKSSCSIRVSRSIEWCRKPIFSASTRL